LVYSAQLGLTEETSNMPKKSAPKAPPAGFAGAEKNVIAAASRLGEDVLQEMEALSTQEIKDKLAGIAVQDAECQVFLKTTEEILKLKEELALIEGPTKDTRKALSDRRAVLVHLLVEKGGSTDEVEA
jgi:hypothetical protein